MNKYKKKCNVNKRKKNFLALKRKVFFAHNLIKYSNKKNKKKNVLLKHLPVENRVGPNNWTSEKNYKGNLLNEEMSFFVTFYAKKQKKSDELTLFDPK